MSRIINWAGAHLIQPLNTAVSNQVKFEAPIDIPGPGELLAAFQARTMTQARFARMMRFHGVSVNPNDVFQTLVPGAAIRKLADVWSDVIDASFATPTPDQAADLVNRGLINETLYRSTLERNKIHPLYVDAVSQLRYQIPGPSDLIMFALREVWDPELLVKFGYNNEFPEAFNEWMSKQGLGYEIPSPAHARFGLGNLTWPKAYWWSHWQLPSLSQGIEMFQRLRMRLDRPDEFRDPDKLLFTRDDLESLLKANDYPTYFRDRLLKLGYNPIGIRNLRNLWKTGLVTEGDVVEIFRDQGYSDRDSLLQGRLIATEGPVAQLASARKKNLQQVVRSYRMGMIGVDEFRRQAYRFTRTTEVEIREFDAEPQAGQDLIALQDQAAVQLVTSTLLQDRLDRFAKQIAVLHRGYVRGDLEITPVRQLLTDMGLDASRREEILTDWTFEQQATRKQATAAKVTKWVREGLLDGNEARARLARLGYTSADSDLMLTDAVLEAVSRQIQAIQRTANSVKAQRRAAQAVARQAQQAARQAAAALATSTNLGRLAGWLRKGYVTPAEFSARASAIGVQAQDIQHYLAEAAKLAQDRADAALRRQQQDQGTTPPPRRQPPAATVVGWLKKGIITEQEARTRLLNLGLDQAAVGNFISQAQGTGGTGGAAGTNGTATAGSTAG